MQNEHPTLLEIIVDLEADVRYQEFASDSEPEIAFEAGTIPILVSAPHGAVHTRNGSFKGEDEFTAGIARHVRGETGAHCIYARRKSKTDPNASFDAPYKDLVQNICDRNEIQFVVDIHGMWQKHEGGLELGTRNGKSCPDHVDLILGSLRNSGFSEQSENRLTRLLVDQRYSGIGSPTREPMVRFVSKRLGIPSVQLEINACNRIVLRREDASEDDKSFQGDPQMIIQTVRALVNMVKAIQGGA